MVFFDNYRGTGEECQWKSQLCSCTEIQAIRFPSWYPVYSSYVSANPLKSNEPRKIWKLVLTKRKCRELCNREKAFNKLFTFQMYVIE